MTGSLYHLEAARSKEQRRYMEGLERDGICVFCPGNQSEPILYEGKHWFATMNKYSYVGTLVHYLIVSRLHVRSFDELSDEAGAELWSIKRTLKNRHDTAMATVTVERSGETRDNGGSIAHLHVHLVVPDPRPTRTVYFRASAHGEENLSETLASSRTTISGTDGCSRHACVLTFLSEVTKMVRQLRAQGRTIVLTSGSFDLIHLGHVRYLQKAKDFGDVLFVGVDSDAKIQRRKGPNRPMVPENERVQILTLQRPVDYVYLKDQNDLRWALVEAVRPDVLVVTEDHSYSDEEQLQLLDICGRIEVLERQASVTTSERIRQMYMHLGDQLGPRLAEALPGLIDSVLREG